MFLQVLLQHGANVEDHNENGHTPLMEAASAGHVEVAKVWLLFHFNCFKHDFCHSLFFFSYSYNFHIFVAFQEFKEYKPIHTVDLTCMCTQKLF